MCLSGTSGRVKLPPKNTRPTDSSAKEVRTAHRDLCPYIESRDLL